MAASLRPVRVPKTAELVAGELRRQIVRGELQEGDSLATEPQLLERFGISRPTLREAFRILESESLIEVRRGARGGARVRLPDLAVAAQYTGLLLQVRGVTLKDVYDARLMIEPVMARLLAEKRTKAAIARLEELADEEEAAIADHLGFVERATDFHAEMVMLAGNQTLAVLVGQLHGVMQRHTSAVANSAAAANRSQVKNRRLAENRRLAQRAHHRLIDLVRDRDGAGAEEFWRRHMEAAAPLLLANGGGVRSIVDVMG